MIWDYFKWAFLKSAENRKSGAVCREIPTFVGMTDRMGENRRRTVAGRFPLAWE